MILLSSVNPVRGEAELRIAGITYRLEATMDDMARLAQALGDPPLHELYRKLIGTSLHASRVALSQFIRNGTDGDGRLLKQREAAAAAVRDLLLSDMDAVQAAMATMLTALSRPDQAAPPGDDEGNRTAASA